MVSARTRLAARRRLAHAAAMLAILAMGIAAGGCDNDGGGDAGGDGASTKNATPEQGQTTTPGGKATSADEKAIRAMAVRLFKSSDVGWICKRRATSRPSASMCRTSRHEAARPRPARSLSGGTAVEEGASFRS